jgi:GNAT superfamily N-acetyltransferase
MTIREATVEDAAILLRLIAAAFEEYVGVLDPPSGAHNETIATVGRKLASGAAALALVDGEPAGCAFYEPHNRNLIYFGRLSVLPRFRNQGIGHALLDYVERRAKDSGAAGVSLGVRLQLPHLLARYERLGYRITRYLTHDGYANPTFVIMEKPFTRD